MFSISPSALLRYTRNLSGGSSNASRSSCARTLFEKKFSIPFIWFYHLQIHSLNVLLYNELKLRNLLICHKPSGSLNK